MKRTHLYTFGFAGLLTVTLAGCGTAPSGFDASPNSNALQSSSGAPASPESPTPEPSDSPAASPKASASPSEATRQQPMAAANTVNVMVYQVDSQCEALVPQQTAVPKAEPMEAAVGRVLEQNATADFSVAGYRVEVANGVATVDLRLAPDSRRQFESLSSCERFALFGSLRETLTQNPQWNVSEVEFTEGGEEIVL